MNAITRGQRPVPRKSKLVRLGDAMSDALIAAALVSADPKPSLAMLGETALREAMRKNRILRRYSNAVTVARLRAEHRTLKAAWFTACLGPNPKNDGE